ncbi:MAG TPA: pyridoxamine 5'-phosphate oxidase family protein [Dehalococcoidia bacterium]|nr:pyridoxamine 5'-phosphate oxidase family protein [Dehalococcoidia bacterium]
MTGDAMNRPMSGRPYIAGYDLSDATGLLPWSWAEERLATAHTYWLATVRAEGMPHVMPVWGVWLQRCFYFSTGPDTRKAKNLAVQPRCVVTTGNGTDDEAVIVEGSAMVETDAAVLNRAAEAYNQKYEWSLQVRDGDVYDEAGNGGPMFAVTPVVVFGFGEEFNSATRWRFQ